MAAGNGRNKEAGGSGNMAVGAILVGLGVLFLLGQTLNFDVGHYMWPLFVIVPGLAFFMAMLAGGPRTGGFAVPGSIVTTIGLLLFYQNATNHWQSWAYAWALIPTAVGIGLIINGTWSGQPRLVDSGMHTARVGVILFVAFGAFFELLLNISGWGFRGQWVWPILLMGLGLLMLFRPSFSRRKHQRPAETPVTPVTTVTTVAQPPAVQGITQDEAVSAIKGGQEKVARIRAFRQGLPDPLIGEKVDAICVVVDKILDDFQRDPKDIKVARKFLDQYLDATTRVIERYADLSGSGSQSPEVQKALAGFPDLLDTIEATFQKQYDRLLRDDALDLETDIAVLKQMMELEGL